MLVLAVAVVMRWFWWDVAPRAERDLEGQFVPVKISDAFSQHRAVFNILKEESWIRRGEQQSSSGAEISQDCPRNRACQIYGAASSFPLVRSWGFLTKNDLFHVHICFPPQILIFIYHTTGNQAVLAENQSIFVQNGISTSHGNCGFQYLLLPFSILGQVFLQPAAPRMCVDRESVCAKLEKSFVFKVFFGEKKLRLQKKKVGCWGGESLKGQKAEAHWHIFESWHFTEKYFSSVENSDKTKIVCQHFLQEKFLFFQFSF